MAAGAGENSQLREIAAAITRLPVEQGVTQLVAVKWVMDPGEMETEGEVTVVDIAVRLLSHKDTGVDADEDETEASQD